MSEGQHPGFRVLFAVLGRCGVSAAEELAQRAYVRVLARRGGAAGAAAQADAAWLRAEVEAEVAVLAAKRIVRQAKRIRRAVRQIGLLSEAAAAAGRVPDGAAAVAESRLVDFDPARFRLVLAEERPPAMRGGNVTAAARPRRASN